MLNESINRGGPAVSGLEQYISRIPRECLVCGYDSPYSCGNFFPSSLGTLHVTWHAWKLPTSLLVRHRPRYVQVQATDWRICSLPLETTIPLPQAQLSVPPCYCASGTKMFKLTLTIPQSLAPQYFLFWWHIHIPLATP